MSKLVHEVEALLMQGASVRMAVLYVVHSHDLGALSANQLWNYFVKESSNG